jgi:ribosomal protein S18 acetylase RimI-like enzyme
MPLVELDDRAAIEAFLRRDSDLHLYELGDLDDFFFPKTRWFGIEIDNALVAIALLYSATDLPVVIALDRDVTTTCETLHQARELLPRRFYSHLTVGAARTVSGSIEPHGLHDRMILRDRSAMDAIDTRAATALGPTDERELVALYKQAYPGNWFDPRMLETRAYFAIRDDEGALVAVSGVHVVSDRTRVAALGNVTTRPDVRGRGLGRIAVAATCKALLERVDLVGLNVESANAAAIGLYRRLGFERAAQYEEQLIVL